MRRNSVLTAIFATATLVGCTGTPSLTPTAATPTFLCTPEAGGAAQPCGPIEHEQAQKRDAEYTEAEAVYRRFWAENERLDSMDSPTITPELREVVAGEALTMTQETFSPEFFRKRVSGASTLVRVDRLPGLSRGGSEVALLTCFDATQGQYLPPGGGEPTAGVRAESRIYLGYIEGSLKIIDSEAREVEKC